MKADGMGFARVLRAMRKPVGQIITIVSAGKEYSLMVTEGNPQWDSDEPDILEIRAENKSTYIDVASISAVVVPD
jgi:hypothetical protein